VSESVILHFRASPKQAAAIRERVGEGNLSEFCRSAVLARVVELRTLELQSRLPSSSARRQAEKEVA